MFFIIMKKYRSCFKISIHYNVVIIMYNVVIIIQTLIFVKKNEFQTYRKELTKS